MSSTARERKARQIRISNVNREVVHEARLQKIKTSFSVATKATEKDTPQPKKTRTIVLITETEETEMQASDNEEDNIPVSQILATELQRTTRPIVLIPETERQASDNEDDNIPVSQILARKEEVTDRIPAVTG